MDEETRGKGAIESPRRPCRAFLNLPGVARRRPQTPGYVRPLALVCTEDVVVDTCCHRTTGQRAHPVHPLVRPGVGRQAGPRVRAGFIEAPVSGTPTRWSTRTARPMTSGATAPTPRLSMAAAKTTKTSTAVRIPSMITACHCSTPAPMAWEPSVPAPLAKPPPNASGSTHARVSAPRTLQ